MGPGPPMFASRPPGCMPPQYPGDPGGPVDSKMFLKEPPNLAETGSALANVELWVQQQNASLQEGPFSPSFGPPGVGKPSRGGNGGIGSQRWMGPMDPSMMGGPPGPGGFMNDPSMGPQGGPGGRMLDENLTPEQLQRREEQLAHLQKIKQMLFPEKRMEFDPRGRPPMMFPGGLRPGGPPDNMGGMMGGMPRFPCPPDGMLPQGMMNPDGMMSMDMGGPGGFVGEPEMPQNWESISLEEREWFKLQHEYYMEQMHKQRRMQMDGVQHIPPGHPGGAYFGGGDMPQRLPPHIGGNGGGGPLSPVSPAFNNGCPSPHGGPMCGEPGMGGEPQGRMYFNGPPRMNFPPNGPGGQDFHPDFMPGGVYGMYGGPPGMGGRMHPHDPSLPLYGPGGGLRFPGNCKPKRRRPAGSVVGGGVCEKPDDIYRHLQPAPSPQQFCSLNLFEGQELTITRQLNLAYQEPGGPAGGTGSLGAEASTARSTPTLSNHPPRSKRKKQDGGGASERYVPFVLFLLFFVVLFLVLSKKPKSMHS